MATLVPEKFNLSTVNGGQEYTDGDGVQPEVMTQLVEGVGYVTEQMEAFTEQPDFSEASFVGTPRVDVVDVYVNGRLYKKLKFSNLKGEPGRVTQVTATVDNSVGTPSASVTLGGQGTDATLHFDFRNIKGEQGVGIKSVTITQS